MNNEDIVEYLEEPKTIYQICAEFDRGYSTIYHTLHILIESKKIKKHKGKSKTVFYKVINNDR